MGNSLEVVSVHVPKTAGTSFRVILQSVYGDALVQDYPDRYDNPLLQDDLDVGLTGKLVVHGHFHESKYNMVAPSAKKIVWVRNPISRVISHFHYLRTVAQNPKYRLNEHREEIIEKDLSLLRFAALPKISNFYTKNYIQELDNFLFVGITEFFAEDIVALSRLMNWPRVRQIRVNESEYHKSVDLPVMEQLCLLNLDDIDLYNRAVRRSGRQL